MAEVLTEHSIVIAEEPKFATKDGIVAVEVQKFAPWFSISWNRQQLTHGVTAVPSGSLVVEIPVEGVAQGGVITPEQLAELLVGLMSAMLPTCNVFVEAVEDEFGHSEKKDF